MNKDIKRLKDMIIGIITLIIIIFIIPFIIKLLK